VVGVPARGIRSSRGAGVNAAEHYYQSVADVLFFGEPDPAGLDTIEDDLGAGAVRYIPAAE
jgi:hypothetical protein